ncbi:MAG: hypothetical protein AABW89_05495 [Nanoarchaeota archaeon]
MSAKLLVFSVILFLGLALGMFMFIDSFKGKLNEATGLVVEAGSFPTYLETHPLISALPRDASIGIKIGSLFYEIDGRNVYLKEELSDEDIIISLPEGYEKIIGVVGLCEAVRKAHAENEVNIEMFSSKVSLFLKYRKLLKYSDCLN